MPATRAEEHIMIKAELGQLDTLSRRLGACSGDVDDLTSLITSTDWAGGAADRFRQAWDAEYRPALDSLSAALVDASTEVDRRRVALDAAGN
jgi:hypothetical protein